VWSYGNVAHAERRALHSCIHTHSAFVHSHLAAPKKTKSMPNWVEFLALATHSNSIRDPDENAFSVVLTSHSCLSPNPCPPHNPRHAPTMPINATPFSLNIIGPLSSCFIYFILFFPLHEPVFICVRRLFAGHLLIRH